MAQMHSYLVANAKSELNFAHSEISHEEFKSVFDQIALAMEERVELFGDNESFSLLEEFFDDDEEVNLENENAFTLDIGDLLNLDASLISGESSINSNNELIFHIDHGDTNFDINEFLDE